jgi:hypothetical protein
VIALFGRACESAFRWFVRRPLQREELARAKAERDSEYWRAKYLEVAAELKANTTALMRVRRADEIAAGAAPDSLPPMRDEMPTLQCFVEGPAVRAWAERHTTPRPARLGRIVETYAPDARPTDPAPADYEALARPFPPPARPPRPRAR